jgi:hypothetical protein
VNKLNGYTILGTLARAFQSHSKEDIEALKTYEATQLLDHIRDFTNNDKYWRWASLARNGQLPLS